ncbi:MAG: hypothetical protein NEA02_08875 [Thermoanaerobaculia bacterium]|nr:hypothetical protein [Thermoanaerobaculia bacterium]
MRMMRIETRIVPLLAALLLTGPALSSGPQSKRCAANDAKGEMMCVHRNGHCAELTIDGPKTVPLTDEATAARIHAIKHGEDVCWMSTKPVSTRLWASAKAGGIFPSFLGKIEKLSVNAYRLDGAKPGDRLSSLNGVRIVADGDPGGMWRLTAEKPLAKGEYVLVFRIFGVGNWDRQAVLVNLDPALKPGPTGNGGPS